MKKIILSLIVALSLISTVNAKKSDSYVGAGVGTGYAGFAVNAYYGDSLNDIEKGLGWEAAYTHNLGSTIGGVEYYATAISGLATYTHTLKNTKVSLFAGLGLAYYKMGTSTTFLGTTLTADISGVSLAYKLTAKYAYTKDITFFVSAQSIFYGVGVEIPFSF